jgi:hypothetical protein
VDGFAGHISAREVWNPPRVPVMSMRQIEVEGKTFEWKAGKSFLRIKGNGRVVDIPLVEYLVNEHGYERSRAVRNSYSGRHRQVGIQPSDIVNYVHKYGWLAP